MTPGVTGDLASAARRAAIALTHGAGPLARVASARRALAAMEAIAGYCHVCGGQRAFLGYEPADMPCKRNSFICQGCGASARNRHLAKCILEKLPTTPQSRSLRQFARNFTGRIWLTCTSGAIAGALRSNPGCVASEYVAGVASGEVADGVLCQDLHETSFPPDSLDLIVTEDVLEHVPDPRRAFLEIRRVLKPGGWHIATVPVDWSLATTIPRAVLERGEVSHILPPEYHGDPRRPEGVLAFTTFGQDVLAWFGLTGPSELDTAHLDRAQEAAFGIYNNWVFISRKPD